MQANDRLKRQMSEDRSHSVVRRRRTSNYGDRQSSDHLPEIPGLTFGECIGHGHFSHVYRGKYQQTRPVAIKVLERGSEKLISTEISILSRLRGVDHVVQLLEVFEADQTILVFELLNGLSTSDILDRISVAQIRRLLRAILEALAVAHRLGIVHRDVKLANILVGPRFREIKLIDWGCGTFITDDMYIKAGSRHCRPPEMLMGYGNYGAGCDIWAVGILIFYILGGGEVPWKARTSTSVLAKMSVYFPREEFEEISRKTGIPISPELDEELEDHPSKTLESWVEEDFEDLADPKLIDLMKKLLTVDLEARPTAEEALQHPFLAI
jgi:serine/threonine protein kinase